MLLREEAFVAVGWSEGLSLFVLLLDFLIFPEEDLCVLCAILRLTRKSPLGPSKGPKNRWQFLRKTP